MSTTRTRHLATFLLVLGAVVFGMVLAGGLQLTLPGMAESQAPLSATQVAAAKPGIAAIPSFADLAQAVDPAVVSIQAATIEKGGARDQRGGGQDPFEFFFGPRGRRPGGPQEEPQDFRSDSGGSGFVISRDGLVEDGLEEKLRELGFDPAGFERGTWQRRCRELAKELGIHPSSSGPDATDETLYHGQYREWMRLMQDGVAREQGIAPARQAAAG